MVGFVVLAFNVVVVVVVVVIVIIINIRIWIVVAVLLDLHDRGSIMQQLHPSDCLPVDKEYNGNHDQDKPIEDFLVLG